MAIGARAGVYPYSLPILRRKALQYQIIQVDETMKKAPRRVQLDRKPSFREVHLNHMCAFVQATPNFALLLRNQGIKVLFS